VNFTFNPFTGVPDAIGTSGGGAGTVTSVAGGVGITNTPEPIVGAGTVDLDIFSLTTGAAFAAGDWLPFVDVSVGTTPSAQRKLTVADLVSAVNGLLDHGLLTGLGDDDHLQYLLLGGRAGTANDPVLTTTAAGTGSVYGGSDIAASLRLAATSNAGTPTGHIETYKAQLWPRADIGGTVVTATDTLPIMNYGGQNFTVNNASSTFGFLGTSGAVTYTVLSTADFTLLRNKQKFQTSTVGAGWAALQLISNNQVFEAIGVATGPGTADHICVNHAPSFQTSAGGSITGATTGDICIFDRIFLTGTISGMIKVGHRMGVSMVGGATLGGFFGIDIDDFTTTGDNIAYRSTGANHNFVHGGYGKFGSSSIAGLPIAGVTLDVFTGFLRARAGVQVRAGTQIEFYESTNTFHSDFNASASQAANIDYTWPATPPASNGLALTATTGGVMSWAAPAPGAHNFLDSTVHNNTATGTPTRGDLIVANTTPAWARFAVGGASTLLKSDGTDPSWGTVNLLSAFHGDTLAGTVARGDVIIGNSTPKWSRLAIGGSGTFLGSDGTDASWRTPHPTIATDVVTGSTSTIPNGSDLTANTVTTTPGSGTAVYLIGSVYWDKTGATNKNVVMKLFKDGTEVVAADEYNHFNLAGAANTSFTTQTAHWVIASESAGSHTYTLRLSESTATANAARRIVSRLTVMY